MAALAAAQVLNRKDAAEDEAPERDDRQRNMDVEDLLRETLISFDRRVEEGQPDCGRQHDRGCNRVAGEASSVEALCRWHCSVFH